jgi:hypothetical protein
VSGVKGDFAKLGAMQQSLRNLVNVPSRAAGPAADGITKELRREYRAGTDPYGKPWAPLAPSTIARGRRNPPLTATRAMAGSTVAKTLPGAGIGLVADFPAAVHQNSRRARLPQRHVFPVGVLPARWREVIERAIRKAFRA